MTLAFPPSAFTPGPIPCRLAHHDPGIWAKAAPLLQQIADLGSTPADSRFSALAALIGSILALYGLPLQYGLSGLEAAVAELATSHQIDFFNVLLPSIARAALRLPDYPTTLPLLPTRAAFAEVSIPRDFAHTLLANAFLGNHPPFSSYPDLGGDLGDWGDSSWLGVMGLAYPVAIERLKCHLAYFHVAASLPRLGGAILIRRVSADFAGGLAACEAAIPAPLIHGGAMEDRGNVIVDFANQYLHINAIIASATQEEVIFSVRPECFLGLMVCQRMDACDAIVIGGARQLVDYAGYARTFKFGGVRQVPFGEPCEELVLAIDASMGRSFSAVNGARDINKAAVGFAACKAILGDAVVSTGGWGTGVFGHDHKLKFLQQLIAGAAAGVQLVYSAYFKPEHEAWYKELSEGVARAAPRVCDLWKLIQGAGDTEADFLRALRQAGVFNA